MAKKYELIEIRDDGTEVRRYEDGTIRNQRGQMLVLPDSLPPLITSENAHEYHKMRKDKILRAIESRVMDITKTKIPADAIGAIVAKRAKIAMEDNTRIGNEAAKIVLQVIDAYQDKVEKATVTRNEYAMDGDTLALLQSMMDARQRADDRTDVLDITAENVDENNIE
jgi:hypothetical protein